MKYVDEYRDAKIVKGLIKQIEAVTTRNWVVMEICGGQTHSIMHYGLDQLISKQIELVHGPGCPVCVTPLALIDKALAIASLPNVIFCSFGDMLRVPGSFQDLFSIKAAGGKVNVVYSPLDAVRIAQENPDKEVVFFAIGFETTAAPNVMAIELANKMGVKNFSLLVSQVLVPPAMEAILSGETNRVQGFLAAGHVCSVMGYWQYHAIADKYHIPIAITGFEPVDVLNGLLAVIRQLENGSHTVENSYGRIVTEKGNTAAQTMIEKYYENCDRLWRGIGMIPMSGWRLKDEWSMFDAEKRFDVGHIQTKESEICIAGQILQGLKKPVECPAFGTLCTPQTPLGATMVSSEGACAAYYRYGRTAESL
jgi:hydrogenase expression/formation protein HypD